MCINGFRLINISARIGDFKFISVGKSQNRRMLIMEEWYLN